jgi:hypothetical protein
MRAGKSAASMGDVKAKARVVVERSDTSFKGCHLGGEKWWLVSVHRVYISASGNDRRGLGVDSSLKMTSLCAFGGGLKNRNCGEFSTGI